MPNANYRAGSRLERMWCHLMIRRGYETTRSAGSKGLIDCHAWNAKEHIYAQIKNGRKAYNDNDIGELIAMPRPAGTKVFLCVRDTDERDGWEWIPC